MLDAKDVAGKVMDEMYSYFDHYYISDGGATQLEEQIEGIIQVEIDKYYRQLEIETTFK
jgi:6-pyruvoyl-tetrahydropterin synthase